MKTYSNIKTTKPVIVLLIVLFSFYAVENPIPAGIILFFAVVEYLYKIKAITKK